jgi:hypothetical protein
MQPIATFLVADNINMLLSSTKRGVILAIQFNPQSLIRLCTKPVTIRKDRRNKDLIIKQHWMAARSRFDFALVCLLMAHTIA